MNDPKWRSPKTAPKDGTIFIGDFGYAWPQVAAWNEHDERWCSANISAQQMENGTFDAWFQNESERPQDLRQWLPMPEIPSKKK
jgi:hypothetical protein